MRRSAALPENVRDRGWQCRSTKCPWQYRFEIVLDRAEAFVEDLVVTLAGRLRSLESALLNATQRFNRRACPQELETIGRLIGRIREVFGQLCAHVPTSAAGAAELIKIAVLQLPAEYSRYEKRLHEIAERLSRGDRDHADLVWLRALESAFLEKARGNDSSKLESLIASAIAGISRPTLVPAKGKKSRSRPETKRFRHAQLENRDGARRGCGPPSASIAIRPLMTWQETDGKPNVLRSGALSLTGCHAPELRPVDEGRQFDS
jgi:hypothetical protein